MFHVCSAALVSHRTRRISVILYDGYLKYKPERSVHFTSNRIIYVAYWILLPLRPHITKQRLQLP